MTSAGRKRRVPLTEEEHARRRAYVERVVAAAPPLTPAQRDRLALLLRGPSR